MKIKTANGAQRLSIRPINLSFMSLKKFIYFTILPTDCKSKIIGHEGRPEWITAPTGRRDWESRPREK